MADFIYNNLKLNKNDIAKSLEILINQCWKILPIYEGRNNTKEIVYSKEEAYSCYQKHLSFLITKLLGASDIWNENQYYLELVYILVGMKHLSQNEHDKVKYFVHHCTKLLNNMLDNIKE